MLINRKKQNPRENPSFLGKKKEKKSVGWSKKSQGGEKEKEKDHGERKREREGDNKKKKHDFLVVIFNYKVFF